MTAQKPTILLIDDDAIVLRTLARALSGGLGWRVLTALSPALAGALYEQADIVITDWAMPDGGGARVLAECTKPVIVMSASGDIAHPHRLPKPVSLSVIEEAVHKLMAESSAS